MNCPYCQIALPVDARYCAGCGKEIPGARGPTAAPSSTWIVAIVIVAGALLMLMMLGIIAAIAIPNFLNAIDRGKQKRTMADLRSVGTAVEEYAIDHNIYPTADTMAVLEKLLEPTYIRTAPTADGWGNVFQVASTTTGYTVCSGGKDGGPCTAVGGGGATGSFNDAIIFVNGQFVQWPEGTQR